MACLSRNAWAGLAYAEPSLPACCLQAPAGIHPHANQWGPITATLTSMAPVGRARITSATGQPLHCRSPVWACKKRICSHPLTCTCLPSMPAAGVATLRKGSQAATPTRRRSARTLAAAIIAAAAQKVCARRPPQAATKAKPEAGQAALATVLV